MAFRVLMLERLTPGRAFQRRLMEDGAAPGVDAGRDTTVATFHRLTTRHPGLSTIGLECTNMPPYADAVRAATGCTAHDITTLLRQRFPH